MYRHRVLRNRLDTCSWSYIRYQNWNHSFIFARECVMFVYVCLCDWLDIFGWADEQIIRWPILTRFQIDMNDRKNNMFTSNLSVNTHTHTHTTHTGTRRELGERQSSYGRTESSGEINWWRFVVNPDMYRWVAGSSVCAVCESRDRQLLVMIYSQCNNTKLVLAYVWYVRITASAEVRSVRLHFILLDKKIKWNNIFVFIFSFC